VMGVFFYRPAFILLLLWPWPLIGIAEIYIIFLLTDRLNFIRQHAPGW
jgi:hypothetical protein